MQISGNRNSGREGDRNERVCGGGGGGNARANDINPGHIRSCRTSRTAGTLRLSRSNSDSSRASRRVTVSSRDAGFSGAVGTPVQSVAPVRR